MLTDRLFIVAVDGSESALRAARFAAHRARTLDAPILLVYVIDWSGFEILAPHQLAERHGEREREIEAAKQRILEPLAQEFRHGGIKVETLARHGHPAESIVQIAREKQASDVVVGRRGRGKVASLLLGSVSSTLAQITPVPLTIVP